MMIAVVGTRGFPDVQGGVERHCEQLYTRLAAQGWDILVFTRSPYLPQAPKWSEWRGIRFRKVWTPRSKSLEAIWHSVVCVILARAAGVRVVHVHSIGPGLAVPLARVLGLRVVFTHHGRDYMREKWGAAAKLMLRLGEWLAVHYAHAVLAVSHEVEDRVRRRFRRPVLYAPNGISVAPRSPAEVEAALAPFHLQSGGYAVTVARLVPEKGVHDLIEAMSRTEVPALVIVGEADHRSPYAAGLKARASNKIQFVGVQPHGVTLDLVRGARVFVLPSYHEGLPIALLEAMACNTPVIASRIAPNCEVVTGGVDGWLVDASDVSQMRHALREVWMLTESERGALTARAAEAVAKRFSWDNTVNAVTAAYQAVFDRL